MTIMEMPLDALEVRTSYECSAELSARSQLRSERGITMIEVLVTLVIVSVGLLGAAAMVINGLESNRNAYLQTQASIFAYDMADRIRSNSDQVGSYTGFEFDAESDEAPELPACFGSDEGCNAAAVAAVDLSQWASSLEGVDGGAALLPSAQATIAQIGGDEVVITITWIESQWDGEEEAFADQDRNFVVRFNL